MTHTDQRAMNNTSVKSFDKFVPLTPPPPNWRTGRKGCTQRSPTISLHHHPFCYVFIVVTVSQDNYAYWQIMDIGQHSGDDFTDPEGYSF